MANKTRCDYKFLDCRYATSSEIQNWANSTLVFTNCDVGSQNVSINYGIYIQALQNGVATISLSEKYFFSVWWGLQQLTYVLLHYLKNFDNSSAALPQSLDTPPDQSSINSSLSIQFLLWCFNSLQNTGFCHFSDKWIFFFWDVFGVSTYGNPLVTSSFIGENLFAIGLTLLSIGLFAQLIGSMQVIYIPGTTLQS